MKRMKIKMGVLATIMAGITTAAIVSPLYTVAPEIKTVNNKTNKNGLTAIKTAPIEYKETANVTISGPKLVKARVGKPFSSAEQPKPIHAKNWKFKGWSTVEGSEENIIQGIEPVPANGWTLYPVFETPALLSNCLCISAIETGTVSITFQATPAANADDIDMWYSKDFGTTWTQLKNAKGTTQTINVIANENLYLKGNNPSGLSTSDTNFTHISFSNKVNLFGNANGLINNGSMESQKKKQIPCAYCFYHLFANDTANEMIQYVADNFFPCEGDPNDTTGEQEKTLKAHCYEGAFLNCAGMYHCPRLFATTKAVIGTTANDTTECYKDIFSGCSNIDFVRTRYDGLSTDCTKNQFSGWVTNVKSSGTFIYNGTDLNPIANFGFSSSWTTQKTPTDGTNADVTINASCPNECTADHKYKFTATCTRDGSSTGVNQEVYWTSSDETVAAIDHISGILTGKPVKTATNVTISCFSKGNLNANATKTITILPIDLGKCTGITGSTTQETKFHISYIGEAPVGGAIPNFKYSLDKGDTWLEVLLDEDITIPATNPATTLYLKGDNPHGLSNGTAESYTHIVSTSGDFKLEGSITGLIDDGLNSEIIPCSYCFNSLFSESNVTSIDSGYLPYTTLTEGCYSRMFTGCLKLTSLPTGLLPAGASIGEIADNCYARMFYGCSNLASIPTDLLQATTLKSYCYRAMFYQCYALKNTCVLPATLAVEGCYAYMFQQCSALQSISDVKLTKLATQACFQTFALVDWNKIRVSGNSGSGRTAFFTCPTNGYTSDSVEYMFYGNPSGSVYTPSAGTTYYWLTK